MIGLDVSAEMLKVARAKPGSKEIAWLQGDAFALPLAPGAFDAVVALRLAFHFSELRRVLDAAAGAVRPGGTIVVDTYNWSPRALVPLHRQTWGGRVYVHAPGKVIEETADLGLEVVDKRECFLFSPYVYRL